MSYLDPNTVEEIVKLRPIFIGVRLLSEFDSGSSENMTVDFIRESVVLSLLKDAFKNMKHAYDPKHRWFLSKRDYRESIWVDRWNDNHRPRCEYTIEEWYPGKDMSNEWFFNFDWWYKNKIASENLSRTDVFQQLKLWKQDLLRDRMPTELLDRWSTEREPSLENVPGDQAAWVDVHGSSVERRSEYDY